MPAVIEPPAATPLALTIPDNLKPDSRTAIETVLRPIFDDAGPLCIKARTIVVNSVDDKENIELARKTRIAIKNIRVAAEKKRVEFKEDALRTTQAIDGIFRPFMKALEAHEDYLDQQERYEQRLLMELRRRVRAERNEVLAGLGESPTNYANIEDMSEEQFTAMVEGIKARKANAEAVRKQAEEERLAREQREREEAQRLREENTRLQRERDEKEKAARDAKAAADAAEKALRARDKAAADAAAAERRAATKAARAGDATKVKAIAFVLRNCAMPQCKSDEAKALVASISTRMLDLADWIEAEAGEL